MYLNRIQELESSIGIHTLQCVHWIASGKQLSSNRLLSLVVCDELERWDQGAVGERL